MLRDVDPVSKVLKPSAADFALVYFSRAGAVVQDITGLTLAEYRAKGYNGDLMVDYEHFALCNIDRQLLL